ncbi:hypothetical protein [Paenibacillus solani]|uniref:hypothetical protein n=1 Tax=Paenibacillus solani TaxID=1705565 RepID=UPI003D26AEC5
MKKKIIVSVFLLCSLFLININSFSFANELPDKKIKKYIENDFKQNYVESLNSLKSEYGVSEQDNFNDAQLSDGIAYYNLSDDNSNSFEFEGYIFSIEIQGEDVGTIYSNEDSGTWKIFRISNENNISDSVEKIESSIQQNDKVKLINDIRYQVNAIYIEGKQERLIDISKQDSNIIFNTKSDSSITKTEFFEKIEELKKNHEALPQTDDQGYILTGASGVDFSSKSNSNEYSYIYLFLAGAFFMLIAVITYRKLERSSKN